MLYSINNAFLTLRDLKSNFKPPLPNHRKEGAVS